MSPQIDLGAVFDEHVANEFVAQDVEATMRTMTAEPYVWHVPTLAGASGGREVRDFYARGSWATTLLTRRFSRSRGRSRRSR